MDSISHKGETYIKASHLARELGYTNDYVGQLCRAGKVEAELVGRSWFVSDKSLRKHKRDRYRNTTQKSKTSLRRTIEEQSDESSYNVPVHGYFKSGKPTAASYETDEADLVPQLRREGIDADAKEDKVKLKVEYKAERIKVKKTEKDYKIITPEAPKIKFKGELKVAQASDIEEVRKEAERTAEEASKPLRKKTTPIVRKAPEGSDEETISVPLTVRASRQKRAYFAPLQLLMVLCLAFSIAALLLGIEITSETHSDGIVRNTYDYNLSAVIKAVKYPLK